MVSKSLGYVLLFRMLKGRLRGGGFIVIFFIGCGTRFVFVYIVGFFLGSFSLI